MIFQKLWKNNTQYSILSRMQERSCVLLEYTYLAIHSLKYKLFAIAATEVKYILGYLAAPSVDPLIKWAGQVHFGETCSVPVKVECRIRTVLT